MVNATGGLLFVIDQGKVHDFDEKEKRDKIFLCGLGIIVTPQ
jgi:hypothetical protein